ncbi:alpha/beta hydrolase [Pseudoroseomonas cervicalis]|uniref:alpha/beta hydrolase n=1 Tax=Teichococcus cervicalis TaxID=204525 RepID=UPI002786ED88|nr:alpha/beta hydrolase-fold protein [Pseudoroseomonas cervicalis]MDQ1079809.1 putative alpha/beta superfamily hydrolase [Pseudoroseomonas cervicalis]
MRRRAWLAAPLLLLPGRRALARDLPAPPGALPLPGLPRSASWIARTPRQPEARHRILLAWPEGPPPATGWPLLYLLDGEASFPMAVTAMRRPGAALRPALLVGLGYPAAAPLDPGGRDRDYTPPAAGAPEGFGGAEPFLEFLRQELQPELARHHPLNPERLAMFGHSYGGLCLLHAFFTRPDWLWGGIAASPSIGWQQGALLETAHAFLAAPPPGTARRRLLITAGSEEEPALDSPMVSPERRERVRQSRMVSRARAMTEALAGLGAAAPQVEFRLFEGESHGSVVGPALRAGLRYLYGSA